jgi:hypothetical protein
VRCRAYESNGTGCTSHRTRCAICLNGKGNRNKKTSSESRQPLGMGYRRSCGNLLHHQCNNEFQVIRWKLVPIINTDGVHAIRPVRPRLCQPNQRAASAAAADFKKRADFHYAVIGLALG